MSKSVAFFDFDGTITKQDSLPHFIIFAVGTVRYYSGLLRLFPILLLYKLKMISNDRAKEKLIGYFFKNWETAHFNTIGDTYCMNQLNDIILPSMLERIHWHKKNGHEVFVVSASLENWMRAWCDQNELGLIATKIESSNGKLTGKFASKNCYGPEKKRRIQAEINLENYNYIYAYGDSKGDREMLSIANEKFFKVTHFD